MSQFLHVFGTLETVVSASELAKIAEEAWYGDDDLKVATDTDGVLLTIALPRGGRPISVQSETDPERVRTMVDEQLDEHEGTPSDVEGQLLRTLQVVSIELFPEAVDDNGWELLDVVQAWLARELEGLVVTDDGIYDSALKKVAP